MKCNFTELENLKPINAAFTKARHRITQIQYNAQFQLNQFPNFDNIVDIECNNYLFFSDRKMVKNFICDLKNKSQVEGEWKGYGGTILNLNLKCEGNFF